MKFSLIIDKTCEEEIIARVHVPGELTRKIEALVLESAGSDRIAAVLEDKTVLLPFSHIEAVTVLDGKTLAIDRKGRRYALNMRLYEAEERLPVCFVRLNRSCLVNEEHILRFRATFAGGVECMLKCGFKDYVSRRCLPELKRRFDLK